MTGQEQPKMLTAEDVLRICVQQLGGICLPMNLYESVGGPIRNVMHNLEEVLRAMEKSKECTMHNAQNENNAQCIMHNAQNENNAQCIMHNAQCKDGEQAKEVLPELEEEEDDSNYIRQTGRIIPPRKEG